MPPEWSASRAWLRNWVLTSALAATVGGLVAELLGRVFLFGVNSLWPPVMESIQPFGTSRLYAPADDRDLLWQLRPSLDAVRDAKVHVSTNTAGLRDREYTQTKPPDTFRVAVIGDSLTMGVGVEIEDVYHSVLETRLNVAAGRPAYEFINFGVAGYQLPQYVATIEKRALAYDPDLILVGLSSNDYFWLDDAGEILKSRPWHVIPTTHPFFEIHLVRQWRLLWRSMFGDWTITEVELAPRFRAHVDKELAEMGTIRKRTGKPICLAYLNYYSSGARDIIAGFRGAAARNDLAFVDVSAAFPPVPDERYAIYRADGHPNAPANAAFADVLLGYLLGSRLVPPPQPRQGGVIRSR